MLKIRRRRTAITALRVSIIIRTKDRPHLLTRSLRSLTEQKRQPDEVVIVNDGGIALDNVVTQFPDLNIHLINHASSQGRAKAGNIGVLAAQGDVIGFLDDDDIYLPDHLQRLEQVMLQFDALVVYSGCRLVQRDLLGETVLLQESALKVFNDGFDATRLRYENYIPLINLLIERDLWLEQNGFDEAFEAFEDWDLLIRLSAQTKFYHLNRITTEYAVWGSSQITREMDKTRWKLAYQQIINKHILALPAEQQLALLTDYWIVSQERRASAQDAQQLTHTLQYQLQEKQQQVSQLQAQLQNQQLMHQTQLLEHREHSAVLQTRYETEYTKLQDLHTEQTQRFNQQSTYFYQQQEQQQAQLKQAQEKITQLQAEVEELVTEQNRLQQIDKQREHQIQHLQKALHETSKQISVGMGRNMLEKVLAYAPNAYALASSSGNLLEDYQRLVEWIRNKAHTLNTWETEQQQYLPRIHETYQHLQTQLTELIHHLTTSRWHFVRRYRGLAQQIELQAHQLQQHLKHYVDGNQVVVTRLALAGVEKQTLSLPIPAPRPLSAVYPTYMSIAGNVEKPHFMEGVAELGNVPFFLTQGKTLVFTTHCTLNDFFRLDVLLATCVRINPSRVRVLIRLLDTGEVIRDLFIEAMETFDNRYYPICFEPIADSANQTYQIEMESPDATDSTCIAVWCHHKQPRLNQGQQLPDNVIDIAPQVLPAWLQEKLLTFPMPSALQQHHAPHIFLIHGLVPSTALLTLHSLITHIGQALSHANTQGQIVVSGTANYEIQQYCQTHAIPLLKSQTFVEELQWVTQQCHAEQILWRVAVSALPHISLVTQAHEILKQEDIALIMPVEQLTNQTIRAAYAVLLRDGIVHCAALGENINHPYHRFGRDIQAGNSGLITLRVRCLAKLDIAQLSTYHTQLYQLTDLIWQLQAQHQRSYYQATFSYTTEQAIDKPDENLLNTDATQFYQCWQKTLPTQHAPFTHSLDSLVNPHGKLTILVIDATLPTFDEDSGSLRMFCWLKMMVAMGYHVTFFADNQDGNPKYRHPLEQNGVEVFYGGYTIADALAHRHFDYAIICRVDVGHRYIPFVRLLSPKTCILYDTVDIHYVRELRRAEIENDPSLVPYALALKRKELSNCLLADYVITVTEDDGLHLRQELPHLAYSLVPNIHLPAPLAETSYAERDGLVFIGNYNHQPNEDAVYFFIEQVLPKVRERLPDVKFYILGSHLRDKMRTLANEYIDVIGWVDKVEPEFAQRRVFVSYLRYGAGMKGKLGQALSLGLPVVSTSIGAEGMGLMHEETALIADDPEHFADAVCRLYTDSILWEKLAQQGRDYIENTYGETAIKRYLTTLFDTVKPL
ncbi:glycosyltransferase [Beggiatoa alba B18LD]|uniref:Glycosyltransferase n=1 Tax=Beggiatoa alba B18LD TaxID=395493 RepID=I3CJT9_9GAMM|nr:glycosyltransferase [Beggiatoa alba]EIJ43882.1 glycosyltransferase [Beggiatoa alba B18LD]